MVTHPAAWIALALALLVVAAAYDAKTGTIPWMILLAALAAGLLAHRSLTGLAYALIPLFAAWRSREESFGYGDVLAFAIIGVTLSPLGAPIALLMGGAAALIIARIQRMKYVRLLPYLAFAACALVLV